jgi:hypothetical protein
MACNKTEGMDCNVIVIELLYKDKEQQCITSIGQNCLWQWVFWSSEFHLMPVNFSWTDLIAASLFAGKQCNCTDMGREESGGKFEESRGPLQDAWHCCIGEGYKSLYFSLYTGAFILPIPNNYL